MHIVAQSSNSVVIVYCFVVLESINLKKFKRLNLLCVVIMYGNSKAGKVIKSNRRPIPLFFMTLLALSLLYLVHYAITSLVVDINNQF